VSADVDFASLAQTIARRAKTASRPLASATTAHKNEALGHLARLLVESKAELLAANALDLEAARQAGLAGAMLDRLTLDAKRLESIAKGVLEVAALPDPVGEVTERYTRPNGMRVERVRLPLGVILIVYEARPNVTIDAAALCLKSGNAVVLRGGKEARHSNEALARIVARALAAAGLPPDACLFVDRPERELMLALLQQDEAIDLAIPRGGEGLIRFVAEHARVPVIKHYKGVCHLYVDRAADLEMAAELAFNAKTSRPGVCNALECLLVHADVAPALLPLVARRLGDAGVLFKADARALRHLGKTARTELATDADFGREFLDLVLAVRVVDSQDEAQAHIAQYGSLHTEVICTSDETAARRFIAEVEASMVGWNVSTRFNDGGELGLGAEMGISTTKLHAFGPMGLRELTSTKFVVTGGGQVR
jgi:glutamate-5-semialdehyde dehydrogenase